LNRHPPNQTPLPAPPSRPAVLSLIAAIAHHGVIGHRNALPWHLPGDLPRFRAITMGHPILMGRRNFESIGRPLPGRRNLVLTRRRGERPEGVEIHHDLPSALAACAGEQEAFVIGGAELYRQTLPLVDRMYLTWIEARYEGDVHFPPFERARFTTVQETHFEGPPPHRLEVLERQAVPDS